MNLFQNCLNVLSLLGGKFSETFKRIFHVLKFSKLLYFAGIAALVTMGLVLRKGMKGKNSVEPEKKKNKRTLSEHNQLAWT